MRPRVGVAPWTMHSTTRHPSIRSASSSASRSATAWQRPTSTALNSNTASRRCIFEELKKRIRIEVRNARYALEQGASRVDAARKARDLAQRTLDIMQKEQKLGVGSNQQTLSAEHDLALAESALVTAETAYEKARIEVRRATGSVLEDYGISIADAKTGVVQADNH